MIALVMNREGVNVIVDVVILFIIEIQYQGIIFMNRKNLENV